MIFTYHKFVKVCADFSRKDIRLLTSVCRTAAALGRRSPTLSPAVTAAYVTGAGTEIPHCTRTRRRPEGLRPSKTAAVHGKIIVLAAEAQFGGDQNRVARGQAQGLSIALDLDLCSFLKVFDEADKSSETLDVIGRAARLKADMAVNQFELARNLPYGLQRALAVAVALATGPELLLLDEPATGINTEETTIVQTLINRIRDEKGITVVLIEHDMKLVMGVCEKLYVLSFGKKIAEGSPAEICTNKEVIAAYLGSEYAAVC